MAILGNRDTASLVSLPDGWDAAKLEANRLENGMTFASVVSLLNSGLAAVNAELYSDPLWSGLVSYQVDLEIEYGVGESNAMNVYTEYGRPDPQRAELQGHMLPLIAYDRALEWTWDYLRKARVNQVVADINSGLSNLKTQWRKSILNRALQRGDDSGARKGLGSSGYSPGFATAAASTSVDFTPPGFSGKTFTSDHEHYVAIAGGAWTVAVFADIKAELREHGHEPPYVVLCSSDDEATIRNLTGFTEVDNLLMKYGDDTDRTTLPVAAVGSSSAGGYFIGTIEDCAVRVVYGMPQYYGFGFKSYGANSPKNPLRIRVGKNAPLAPYFQAFPDPRSNGGANYPLQNLMFFGEYGVGVGEDRTAATARYNNNATWADGSAS
jgi:hypothetical protein